MVELLKSASRFCLATALFGVRQLGEVFAPGDTGRAAQSFRSMSRATEGELDQFWLRTFRTGNQLGAGLCDVASDLLTLDAFTSRGMTRAAINTMQYSAGGLAAVLPVAEGGATLREFRNKVRVFSLFENVDRVLGLSPRADHSLRELIARTAEMDSFDAVWVTEGIGHYYTETVWARGTPHRLLRENDLPRKSLVALHAGMGLSLAERLLARAGQNPSELRALLGEFVRLCRDNSNEAYLGASYEALGLVARNLYPRLLFEIDKELSELGDDQTEYFWHGVGRAIYFAPTNYVPLSAFAVRVVEMTQQEPPHHAGRQNALAGAIWAMVLVNLREPEVIENFLACCDRTRFEAHAFANGVSSASIIWRDSTGDTAPLETLCRHRSRPEVAERWDKLIHVPCRQAMNERHGSIGEIFRYQSTSRQNKVAIYENRNISSGQQIDRLVSRLVHRLVAKEST